MGGAWRGGGAVEGEVPVAEKPGPSSTVRHGNIDVRGNFDGLIHRIIVYHPIKVTAKAGVTLMGFQPKKKSIINWAKSPIFSQNDHK